MPEKKKDVEKAEEKKEKPAKKTETKKTREKTEKKETKKEKKPEKAEKEEKKKAVRIIVKKKKPKKSEEAKQALKAIAKKKKPGFRGRFGKSSVRRKSKAKWRRWRVPRGKDIKKTKQYGKTPKSGYRTAKAVRARHPSGYYEKIVHNKSELELLVKERERIAARISARVGEKKRSEIIKRANELGIKILN